MLLELNRIYNEDCLITMARMPDNFVDLTVTSPPYDNLRTYNGYTFDFESVAQELYRVTKPGGVVVWVVGDETKNFCESTTSFKQALFFKEQCNFNLLDTMIYFKKNYAPAYPSLRRYANQFEYMFIFSKGKPKTFNPIQKEKVIKNYKDKKSYFRQQDGTQKLKIISNNRETKDASNVWEFSTSVTDKNAKGHPAIFPEQLANDHIISWSNENDLVYDPFMGSGTTAKMALLNNRSFIGSEISKEYVDIARKRIQDFYGEK
jgi:site-specific DNA-methyltransferase (adenine-specific)